MTPRERVMAALAHREPDRVPRFEIWIDAFLDRLGDGSLQDAHVRQGQDCIMLPNHSPIGSKAWRNGVDEFGRVWRDGTYAGGRVDTEADLDLFTPSLVQVHACFDPIACRQARENYPDHIFFYGSHIGPLTATYMAMGFERFFVRLVDDPTFVHRLLERRTEWCVAMFQRAVELGAELLVLGDDAAHRGGPMLSPKMWHEFVLPYHRRLVREVTVPVIWHSDGDIRPLLPDAIEVGFAGVHGLEPAAGIDLAATKRDFGRDLVLVGNIAIQVLYGPDLAAVRAEVDRCLEQGTPGGGYLMASCNSIFNGLNPEAVVEMFRYQAQIA